MKLRKGDKVMIRAGRDQGKTGQIVRVMPAEARIVVEGLNIVKRHTKPSNKHPKGGILEIAKPLPAGKVALVCPNCKQAARVGYEVKGEHKERVCRKCKVVIKS